MGTSDIEPGEAPIAGAEDDPFVLQHRNAIVSQLRSRFAEVPDGVSLADELIAERRRESEREREA